MSWLETFTFVCPACHGPVVAIQGDAPHSGVAAFACAPCARRYPVLLGIPDFRVARTVAPLLDAVAYRGAGR